ncbi:Gp138 family membrane-puncturing spike protein [Pseudomonas kurunegalensis]|uniref:Gp138 family membrane-puncturing spike protein n=1 Tax=Pseudomonas kurunegalensis TaxID=485880 RepID=UPI0040256DD0
MSDLLGYVSREITNSLAEVNTIYLARVIGVAGSTVSVEMLSQRLDTEDNNNDDVPVHGIPVYMPSTGLTTIRFPVKVGDTVICVVNQTTMDPIKDQSVRQDKGPIPVAVQDFGRFNAQNAIAIPFNLAVAQSAGHALSVSPDDLVIAHNVGTGQEAHIVVKPNGDIGVESQFTVNVKAKDVSLEATQSISLKAQTMSIDVPTTTWNGNYSLTGEATFNGIPFSTHKHTGVTPGTGTSATPVA